MLDEWVVDDDSIPDDAHIHRRLIDPGDLVIDQISGQFTVSPAAYRYLNDGMSVYVSTAMATNEISDVELIAWNGQALARVAVATVRRADRGEVFASKAPPTGTVVAGEDHEQAGGVTLSEAQDGPEDARVRRSHGLVRLGERPPARVAWNAFRNKLLQASEVKRESQGIWVDCAADR